MKAAARCGTTSGYSRHLRLGESVCAACRAAYAVYERDYRRRRAENGGKRLGLPVGTSPIDWAKCGTEANYRRHYRLGEKPCRACIRARQEAYERRKARRRGNVA